MSQRDCNEARKDMNLPEMVELIRHAPPGPWPTKKDWIAGEQKWRHDPERTWHCWDVTHAAMRYLAQEFIDGPLSRFQPVKAEGKGIIIAGGMKPLPNRGLPHGYLPCVWLLVNKIRMMGTRLPIQLWYMGDEEMDPYTERLLATLGVECVDANRMLKTYPCRILCGWELKPYAALYCPFEEVLFLDADNCPINFPVDALFEQREYQELGSCFWPDYGHWDLSEGIWDIFGIPATTEPAFESGQFLINKRKCWRELRLALWYAEYSDYVFGHVYGDKEVFHLGWRKLHTPYAMPEARPGWEGNLCIVQHDTSGRRVLLHRCQDKWKLHGGNAFLAQLEDEQMHHEIVKSLREKWNGKGWYNPKPSPEESQVVASLVGRRFLYKRLPKKGFLGDEREIVLDPGGRVGVGSAECETRWDVNEVPVAEGPNRMTLALSREDRVTCILSQRSDKVWSGAWVVHECCEVELQPLGVVVKDLTPHVDVGEIVGFIASKGYDWREEDTQQLTLLLERCRVRNRSAVGQIGKSPPVGDDQRQPVPSATHGGKNPVPVVGKKPIFR